MICTVIQHKTFPRISEILSRVEMAEIRLDRCSLTDDEIEACFESDTPTVATCRVSEIMAAHPELSETKAASICEDLLCKAIRAGARYVDVEIEAPKYMSKRVRACAQEYGSTFIKSYHDFERTESLEVLKNMVEKCRHHGAELVKIVTTAHDLSDPDNVLALYDYFPPAELIAFSMGEAGKQSRLQCLAKGAPYTYAALSEDDSAAPGQWTVSEMSETLYRGRSFANASIVIPSSKSFAQRAIIAAALADGTSRLSGYSPCGDNEAAIAAAAAIGAEVNSDGDVLEIKGIAAAPGCIDIQNLHTGESGLLTRLMIPVLPMISKSAVKLTGEKTLLERPLKGAAEMMSAFGVSLKSGADDCRIPLEVSGPLQCGKAEISGKYGSQLISGLLMALPLGEKYSALTVVEPKSIPYMFITLDVMRKFGVKVKNEMAGGQAFVESGGDWSHCTEMEFKVRPGQRYHAADFAIEGDWSSAANFLVAGAIFGKVTIEGLDTASLQADLSIMDILMEAGASLSQTGGSTGPVTVQRSPLKAFETDASNCPDLFPVISVLAAFCQGTSRIAGVDRLAHKESDRGKAIVDMLGKMGVVSEISDNVLVIEGHSLSSRLLNGRLLKGGEYTSSHDHRMVMALKVAELGADAPVVIDDTDCVAKSFPMFFDLWNLDRAECAAHCHPGRSRGL